jgi:hypothetical protein
VKILCPRTWMLVWNSKVGSTSMINSQFDATKLPMRFIYFKDDVGLEYLGALKICGVSGS